MTKKQKETANAKSFEDAARALDCDESEERFDAALRKIAAHKPDKAPTRQPKEPPREK